MGCSLICAVGLRCSRPTHTDTAAPEQTLRTGCTQLRGWNEALTKAGLGVQIPPGRSICHSSLVCVETRGRHTEIDTGCVHSSQLVVQHSVTHLCFFAFVMLYITSDALSDFHVRRGGGEVLTYDVTIAVYC